ncbi:MAG: MFS transporter [Burkholderiales bacterium]|nr:MFS transporter [Opitutaceae bacterium]
MTTPALHRLSMREKLAYGCGDFASCLFWATFMKKLSFFYTDVFGITAGALATMLLVSRIWDGVNDPLIGILADRTKSRWGKFRPWILFGCVPLSVAAVLTFTTPDFDAAGKLIWAYVTYNILMMLYTAVNIPYTAMLGVITPNPVERTRLSSIKFMFAFGAGWVVSLTIMPLVDWLGATSPQRGWQLAFMIYGVVAVVFFLFTFFGTRERVVSADDETASVWRDLKYLVTNRAWLLLVATTFTWILFVGVRSTVSTHFMKYNVFNGSETASLPAFWWDFKFTGATTAFDSVNQGASLLGVILTSLFASRVPKRIAFIGFFLASIIGYAAFYFVSPQNLPVLFVLEFFASMAGAALPVLMWAMYADTADYGEYTSGRRTTGLIFSASTMSQQIGWAVAAFFALKLMAFVGFTANVTPTPEVQHHLTLLMSLIPGALGLLSIVVFLFYPLTDQRVVEIGAELEKRRTAAGNASAA